MDKQVSSALRFKEYKVNRIEFELNPKCDSEEVEFDFDVDVDTAIEETDNGFDGIVKMTLYVFRNAIENNFPFELTLSIVGVFSSKNMTKEQFAKAIKVNGVTILFPFLRSAVADITKTANTDVLYLPLINIHRLLEYKEKNKQ